MSRLSAFLLTFGLAAIVILLALPEMDPLDFTEQQLSQGAVGEGVHFISGVLEPPTPFGLSASIREMRRGSAQREALAKLPKLSILRL
jgi:hypothetical protein